MTIPLQELNNVVADRSQAGLVNRPAHDKDVVFRRLRTASAEFEFCEAAITPQKFAPHLQMRISAKAYHGAKAHNAEG
jgi:hypothetical protein